MINLKGLIISFGLLLIAMTVHEFAHAWTAYLLGDKTAKHSGRLTLNPLAHIDPVGTILLPLILFISTHGQFVFGAAKPVPINYLALKNPKKGIMLVGISGPLANFLFAFILSLILRFLPLPGGLIWAILYLIYINVILGVFNLVPIPPLDGSRVVIGLLPENLSLRYASIEPFGFIILLALIMAGIFNSLVWPIAKLILRVIGIN